ncbi:MAG: GIY-YIG nuclease family protein [Patescibacteria group bacterium]
MKLTDQIKKLPDSPGVYLFKKGKEILYVGKATSLRDRVRSYFSADLINTRGQFVAQMVFKTDKVDYLKTDSVLEALILESNLIKKHQPKYNTKEKDDKSYNYVVITKEDFPRVLLVRGRELEKLNLQAEGLNIKYKFGPYPNGSAIKEGLKIIRKIFPYRDKCAPYGSVSFRGIIKAKPCFNRQIGLCPGVCSGEISKADYADTIRNIKLFFEGKKKAIIKKLERQMKEYAKNREFEKAGKAKRTLFALNHIQDVALIKKPEEGIVEIISGEPAVLRMEAYDVAHISGTNMVGVMTVLQNGELKKSDYRKFKIRSVGTANDTATLKEILERRLRHKEWPLPDIIVYDGGVAQRNAVEEVLKNNLGENHKVKIAGVVKDEKHKPARILGEEEIIKKYKKEIILLNSEAHRFAIGFHRKLRSLKH